MTKGKKWSGILLTGLMLGGARAATAGETGTGAAQSAELLQQDLRIKDVMAPLAEPWTELIQALSGTDVPKVIVPPMLQGVVTSVSPEAREAINALPLPMRLREPACSAAVEGSERKKHDAPPESLA
jgi:hypothetical protein